jgi:hypothetical protein
MVNVWFPDRRMVSKWWIRADTALCFKKSDQSKIYTESNLSAFSSDLTSTQILAI